MKFSAPAGALTRIQKCQIPSVPESRCRHSEAASSATSVRRCRSDRASSAVALQSKGCVSAECMAALVLAHVHRKAASVVLTQEELTAMKQARCERSEGWVVPDWQFLRLRDTSWDS
jgi:hypothetical protein